MTDLKPAMVSIQDGDIIRHGYVTSITILEPVDTNGNGCADDHETTTIEHGGDWISVTAPDPRVQALVDALRVAIDALHTIDDRHYTAVKMFNDATQWDEETYHDGRCLSEFVFGDAHSAKATASAALKQWEDGE